ncbi:hypothetical protein BJ170DRAFT_694499 [Xylariales sp. AK1849]|nr:hypothetical protein BJ170DRAFT_694499 [Xylariales sp. AK1849]
MNTTAGSSFYDPDAPLYEAQNGSPPMTAHRPRLEPSPSPQPAIPLPRVSPSPSPGRKSSNRRHKVPPSQGDAVLIHYLDGGKRPDIAAVAGLAPLAGWNDDEDDEDDVGEEEEDSFDSSSSGYTGSAKMSPDPRSAEPAIAGLDLKAFAAAALSAAQPPPITDGAQPQPQPQPQQQQQDDAHEVRDQVQEEVSPGSPDQQQQKQTEQQQSQAQPPPPPQPPQHPQLQPLQPRDVGLQNAKPVLVAPITPYTPHGHPEPYSPRLPSSSQVLRHPGDIMSPGIPTPSSHGELPPIQMASPKSEVNGHAPLPSLPSIRAHLGDQLTEQPNFADKEFAMRHAHPPFSPSAGMPRMSIIPGTHASPPISPNNSYSQSMPSPAHSSILSPYGYYSSSSSTHPRNALDYSSASSHTETPNTDLASTPAASITDRMSIDNMTNPQLGSFVCKFHGCSAPPFQTQYLLNSHANVHSSARPHYCPVKGCPRSENGKGFKRKNEMIRHGLVHESPGYVCPFCPDREHKYPRPDNLQRHVRVHHVDKDKDDPLLRDVLAQRPDGPNRGRRRRGVP